MATKKGCKQMHDDDDGVQDSYGENSGSASSSQTKVVKPSPPTGLLDERARYLRNLISISEVEGVIARMETDARKYFVFGLNCERRRCLQNTLEILPSVLITDLVSPYDGDVTILEIYQFELRCILDRKWDDKDDPRRLRFRALRLCRMLLHNPLLSLANPHRFQAMACKADISEISSSYTGGNDFSIYVELSIGQYRYAVGVGSIKNVTLGSQGAFQTHSISIDEYSDEDSDNDDTAAEESLSAFASRLCESPHTALSVSNNTGTSGFACELTMKSNFFSHHNVILWTEVYVVLEEIREYVSRSTFGKRVELAAYIRVQLESAQRLINAAAARIRQAALVPGSSVAVPIDVDA